MFKINTVSISLLIKCVNPNEKKKHIVKQYTIKVLSTLSLQTFSSATC